jgi:CubicO group peptidase (beta-lactamase class C family)
MLGGSRTGAGSKPMRRHAIAALAMMPITFTLASGVAQAQNAARSTALIDKPLREAVERNDVPGVVALVTDRKGVLYQGAFGVADVATGRALTADALFRIASMTKPITSVAAMQLVEQGRLVSTIRSRSICRSLPI